MIKVSAVSYTNTLPFIYGLQNHPVNKKIDLSLDIPSICAEKLITHKVDIGLVPIAALPALTDYEIITDYCIGANGAVNSVFIFSNCPIADIQYLQLDPQSRTSNQLAKVLLKYHWKKSPLYIENALDYSNSTKSNTAFVQIGDRTFHKLNQFPYMYDLSETWKVFTGLEFVFAVWVGKVGLESSFKEVFNQALKFGLDNRLHLIENLEMIKEFDLVDYLLHKIDYNFNNSKKEALNLFLKYTKDL